MIVMLGTSFDSMGGVSTVINGYREAGLFRRFPVLYIATHSDGSRMKKFRVFLLAWLRFLSLLLRNKISALHVHMSSNASFWRKTFFLFPAFLLRVPSILHLHGGAFDIFYERNNNRFKKFLIRTVLDRVDSIIVLSEARKKWIQSISSNANVDIIYNAVDVPSPSDFSGREAGNILFLGQLGAAKGIYDLLTALSQLLTRHPDLKLLLGGDGAHQAVQDAVKDMNLNEHVEILGWVSGDAKTALLQRAAIYALPSYAEGMPMSVLEAMAAGMPVVATSVGGLPEAITDGIEGSLVAPGDVNALIEAIDRLLRDADLRRRMGLAARKKVESTFSYQQVMPQIEQLYLKLYQK